MKDTTALIDKVKGSMRILSKSTVIENDINGSIEACKRELSIAGVKNIDETDSLITKAVILYVKADFNYQNMGEKYRQSYESLKTTLSLSSYYNTTEVEQSC